MSKSETNEILMTLAIIAALLAKTNGQNVLAAVFFLKALCDFGCAVFYARRELKEDG